MKLFDNIETFEDLKKSLHSDKMQALNMIRLAKVVKDFEENEILMLEKDFIKSNSPAPTWNKNLETIDDDKIYTFMGVKVITPLSSNVGILSCKMSREEASYNILQASKFGELSNNLPLLEKAYILKTGAMYASSSEDLLLSSEDGKLSVKEFERVIKDLVSYIYKTKNDPEEFLKTMLSKTFQEVDKPLEDIINIVKKEFSDLAIPKDVDEFIDHMIDQKEFTYLYPFVEFLSEAWFSKDPRVSLLTPRILLSQTLEHCNIDWCKGINQTLVVLTDRERYNDLKSEHFLLHNARFEINNISVGIDELIENSETLFSEEEVNVLTHEIKEIKSPFKKISCVKSKDLKISKNGMLPENIWPGDIVKLHIRDEKYISSYGEEIEDWPNTLSYLEIMKGQTYDSDNMSGLLCQVTSRHNNIVVSMVESMPDKYIGLTLWKKGD